MIKEFVKAWDSNKGKLEEYIRTNKLEACDSYEKLVKLLFEHVINPEMNTFNTFDLGDITTLGGDSCQGTYVFILHSRAYGDPDVDDYVYTYVDYGSCSGCDTLIAILEWDELKLPTDDQVADLMTLCLHLLQRCHRMIESEDEE